MDFDSIARVVLVSVAASVVVRVLIGEDTGAVGRAFDNVTSVFDNMGGPS